MAIICYTNIKVGTLWDKQASELQLFRMLWSIPLGKGQLLYHHSPAFILTPLTTLLNIINDLKIKRLVFPYFLFSIPEHSWRELYSLVTFWNIEPPLGVHYRYYPIEFSTGLRIWLESHEACFRNIFHESGTNIFWIEDRKILKNKW